MKIMSENEGAGDLTYDGADDDINPNDSVSNVGKHSNKCHQ